MFQITIPKPCNERWDSMTPNEQGRHCCSCAKTVVDFTQMTGDEVKSYFIGHAKERVCGRFNNTQLKQVHIDLPQNIFQLQLPVWKQFLVASLLAFSVMLFSCTTSTTGEIELSGKVAISELQAERTDTIKNPIIVGNPVPTINDPVKCSTRKTPETVMLTGDTIIISQPEQRLLGEPAFIPERDRIYKKGEIKMIPVSDTMPPEQNEQIMGGIEITNVKKNEP